MGISMEFALDEVGVGIWGSWSLLEGIMGELDLVSKGSEALTCRLGRGVGSDSVSRVGEENSAAMGVLSMIGATAG